MSLCLLAARERALPPGGLAAPGKGSRAVVRGILGNAMSQQDMENVRQAYEAWESQGVEGLIAFLDAEVEWRAPAEGVGGVFKGHEGVREWSRQVDEVFEEVHFEPDQIEDLPDERVLAVGRARFRGRGSGVDMEIPFAYLIEIRAGKTVGVTQYTDIEAAQRAAGLAE